jgi:hypothetical protein
MYSAPTTPPSRSSEIWWSGRWDRQHDGVVSMVESMRRQGFACLRGGERTEKGGFRNRAAAPQKLGLPNRQRTDPFYMRRLIRVSCYLHDIQDGQTALTSSRLADLIRSDRSQRPDPALPCHRRPIGQRPIRPRPFSHARPIWPRPSRPPQEPSERSQGQLAAMLDR